jgi:general secretion pathway protein A
MCRRTRSAGAFLVEWIMIEEYWNLQFNPFQNQVAQHWYYESPMHDETLARLYYVIEKRQRCGVFIGPAGTGKSLLLQLLRRQSSRTQRQVALIDVYAMDGQEILWNLLGELGLGSYSQTPPSELWRVLTDHLTGASLSRQQLVFLFDHLVHANEEGRQCIERIMHLTSTLQGWATSIFSCRPDELSGFPSGIYGQVDLKIKLEPLDAFHTSEYVRRALRQAGATRTIFSTATMHHLYDATGGIPRAINQLCHLALVAGANAEIEEISPALLSEVSRELAVSTAEPVADEAVAAAPSRPSKSTSRSRKKSNG